VEAVAGEKLDERRFDIDAVFRSQYERIARLIARVVRDRARAEEIAVEAFVKLWRTREAQGDRAEGWLYRVAARMALDELRRQTRRSRYESLFGLGRRTPTPEDVRAASEERDRVRSVLEAIGRREAELLLLRSHGFSYEEAASALGIHPASVGTLIARAQQAFRKEYVKRYGEQ
jgi:RNA polymerase sigma-70 factor (ECF subfamily)